jgi:hypothetical protein
MKIPEDFRDSGFQMGFILRTGLRAFLGVSSSDHLHHLVNLSGPNEDSNCSAHRSV